MDKIIYPSWHFIGSKHSIWPWIKSNLPLKYNSVVDLFGGSGVCSQGFRLLHKEVFYNDFLKHLQIIASGLLRATKNDQISTEIINSILSNQLVEPEHTFFKDNFSDVYFFEDEALWIDIIHQRIQDESINPAQKSLLFFALTQSCLKKRPFHTFHGSFLNLRLKKRETVQTWDLDMADTFRKTITSINTYLNQLPLDLEPVSISGLLASKTKPEMISSKPLDILYLDPPFISNKKKRTLKFANYVKNYSVLELLANYKDMESLLDPITKKLVLNNYPPAQEMDLWIDQNQKNWFKAFDAIINNFQDSIIIVSYRSDSLITSDQIKEILESYKQVNVKETPHVYEIPEKESKFNDLLFIAN